MLLYELLLGLVPWDGSSPEQIMDQIKAADVVWPPEGMVSTGSCLLPVFLGEEREGVHWGCVWSHR